MKKLYILEVEKDVVYIWGVKHGAGGNAIVDVLEDTKFMAAIRRGRSRAALLAIHDAIETAKADAKQARKDEANAIKSSTGGESVRGLGVTETSPGVNHRPESER